MHVSAPARWHGRKKEALALLRGETARHLSPDVINESLRFRERLHSHAVSGGGQNAAAVGREHRAFDRAGVALEGGEWLTVEVPQPSRPVIGAGQDAAAVGRENRAVDLAGMALGRTFARADDSHTSVTNNAITTQPIHRELGLRRYDNLDRRV
jgi:hypothetical protein